MVQKQHDTHTTVDYWRAELLTEKAFLQGHEDNEKLKQRPFYLN